MPKAQTEELARIAPGSSALAVMAGADKTDTRGKESIESDDMLIPRFQVAQSMTPHTKPQNSAYIEGLTEGMLFNTLTGAIYRTSPSDRKNPPEPLHFAVIRMDKRAVRTDEDGKIVERDIAWDDPRCLFTDGPNGERVKPTADRVYDFIIALADTFEVTSLSLKSTAITRTAKPLASLLALRPGVSWGGLFSLTVVPEKKDSYDYWGLKILPAGPTPPALAAFADDVFEGMRKKRVVIDRDNDDVQDAEPVGQQAKVPF
jgi:hypothetical protein